MLSILLALACGINNILAEALVHMSLEVRGCGMVPHVLLSINTTILLSLQSSTQEIVVLVAIIPVNLDRGFEETVGG